MLNPVFVWAAVSSDSSYIQFSLYVREDGLKTPFIIFLFVEMQF